VLQFFFIVLLFTCSVTVKEEEADRTIEGIIIALSLVY
jgi:hypothetical protein